MERGGLLGHQAYLVRVDHFVAGSLDLPLPFFLTAHPTVVVVVAFNSHHNAIVKERLRRAQTHGLRELGLIGRLLLSSRYHSVVCAEGRGSREHIGSDHRGALRGIISCIRVIISPVPPQIGRPLLIYAIHLLQGGSTQRIEHEDRWLGHGLLVSGRLEGVGRVVVGVMSFHLISIQFNS